MGVVTTRQCRLDIVSRLKTKSPCLPACDIPSALSVCARDLTRCLRVTHACCHHGCHVTSSDHSRGVIMPFAVATTPGLKNITVGRVAGCSSLLRLNQGAWAKHCRDSLEQRTVEAITLSRVFELAGHRSPASQGPLPVRLLKIDAQGVDFALLYSTAPSLLQRVQQLSIELPVDSDECKGRDLYDESGDRAPSTCQGRLDYLRLVGFTLVGYAKSGPITDRAPTIKDKQRARYASNHWVPVSDSCEAMRHALHQSHSTGHNTSRSLNALCEVQVTLINTQSTSAPVLEFDELYTEGHLKGSRGAAH